VLSLTYTEIAWTALVVFGAFVGRGISGFGAGLLATPLLALMLPMRLIVPLNALLVFVLFLFLSIRDRHEVVWRELKLLVPPTLAGVAAGLFLFSSLDNRGLLVLLGGFLVLYASYMLLVHVFGLPQVRCSETWSFPAGALGSFIDTLFGGGGGTIVVIYAHARGLTKMPFRATVAMLWFIEMVARISGYTAVGFYNPDVLLLVAAMLPFVAAGTWVGERIGNRVNQQTFSKVLAVMLLLSGINLLLR
jgi:uncharacterized membrane protein YfcA